MNHNTPHVRRTNTGEDGPRYPLSIAVAPVFAEAPSCARFRFRSTLEIGHKTINDSLGYRDGVPFMFPEMV